MKLPPNFSFSKHGLTLRYVKEDDAEFILKLRTNQKLSRFINPTPANIELQKEWIKRYKQRELNGTDYYFIFFFNDKPVGLNRIYNIKNFTFTTGSWIFDPNAPEHCSIASAIIVRIIAFELLGKEIEISDDGCHVDNKKVLKFNKMIGLKINGEIETEIGKYYTFIMKKEDFYVNKSRIESLINQML